jgi:Uma2 family endonuclease
MPAESAPDDETAPINSPAVERAFEAVPPEMVAEILDGELSAQPRPARAHTRASSRLGSLLGGAFDLGTNGPGGWVILDEPELHLGPRPDKLVPDLAGWRRERMPDAVGADPSPYYYDLVPDWVCEVLSPSTEAIDRGKKMRIYRREGVRNVWLVNPITRTLEVYRLEDGRWIALDTFEGSSRVRAEPFEAMEMALEMLWAG